MLSNTDGRFDVISEQRPKVAIRAQGFATNGHR